MSEIAQKYSDDPNIEPLIEELIESGDDLPDELHQKILAADEAVDEALINIVDDQEMADDASPGQGWSPIFAAQLLGERRTAKATESLIDVIRIQHPDTYIYTKAAFALERIGEPALEPILAVLDEVDDEDEDDEDFRYSMNGILAELGVRDDRIFEILIDLLDEDPVLGACFLSQYGDPRALNALQTALDEVEVKLEAGQFANQAVIELVGAIEGLGAAVSEEQQAKLEQVKRLRQVARQQMESARNAASKRTDRPKKQEPTAEPYRAPKEQNIGRNEPCWCGSGKKYKRCHWREDNQ